LDFWRFAFIIISTRTNIVLKDLKVSFILVIDAGVSATLAALTPRLKDFHQLLVDPPPVSHNLISCEFVFMVITHPGFLLGHSNQQTQG